MKLPKHINITLEHNPHTVYYEDIVEHCISCDINAQDWVSQEEKEKAYATNDFWTAQWYPDTPIGFCFAAASTLEALAKFLEDIKDEQ